MNIRKWVQYVLNHDQKSSRPRSLEVESMHFIDSDEISSALAGTTPEELIEEIRAALSNSPTEVLDVDVDVYDSSDTVGLFVREQNDVTSVSDDIVETKVSAADILFEKAFYRMRQHGIYKFGCLVDYETTGGDARRGLEDIVSDIRAIPTVTIVSVVLANEKVATGRYVAGLQIKFIPSFPGSLSQPEDAKAYILRMIKKIKNVRGISRVTLKTDRIE